MPQVEFESYWINQSQLDNFVVITYDWGDVKRTLTHKAEITIYGVTKDGTKIELYTGMIEDALEKAIEKYQKFLDKVVTPYFTQQRINLERRIQELETELYYRPGGGGYYEGLASYNAALSTMSSTTNTEMAQRSS